MPNAPGDTILSVNGTMDEKTCIVTGASSGIGKETARSLAGMGARVVMVSRDQARGAAARDDIRRTTGRDVEWVLADLSSQASIRDLAARILEMCPRIDVLVNNAGALYTSRQTTVDGFERTFATNHLNYFLLTHLLLDRIKDSAPARIVNVSSRAHMNGAIDFEDPHFERRRYNIGGAYSQSKLANVLFTYELARRLEGTGVTVNCLHPGVVRTGFAKNNGGLLGTIVKHGMRVASMFFMDAAKGAQTSVFLAASPEVEGVTGRYFVRCKDTPSSERSYDIDAARRLWELSENLCGLPSVQATESAGRPAT
jgi:NAD(P)-dependent dehydrogenase (short-subunit alcohol dehydrogenase family)